MKRLRRAIKQIVARRDHYLGQLWHWAAKRGVHTGNDRWIALAQWAQLHKQYAWHHAHWARKHGKRRRAHRLDLRAQHFLQIELAYRQENRRLKKRYPKHQHQDPQGDLVYFDGKPHAGWIVRQTLIPARAAGWPGISYSGYRTPEYSEHLCEIMCGQPTCPGRCAGRGTEHALLTWPGGAVDVTFSVELSSWEAAHGFPTRHTLPFDLPHHSESGG